MIDYTDHDFRPAQPGWRAVYLTEIDYFVTDLAGWLIQLETRLDDFASDDDPRPRAERPRRVVAAAVDGGEVCPCVDDGNFWLVLGPSDPLPSAQQADRERDRRKQAAA